MRYFRCKNPIVKSNFKHWLNELMCKYFGCLTSGPYYGMPQAHCPRCGHINKGIAYEDAEEWSEPYL